MKNIVKSFIAICLLLVIVTACNQSNTTQPTPTQIQALTSHAWKLKTITARDYAGGIIDVNIYKDCMSDDSLVYSLSGLYNLNNGTQVCDSNDIHYNKGYWGYDLNTDSIQMISQIPDTVYRSFKVLTINDTVLKVTYIDSATNDDTKLVKIMSFGK